MKNTNLIPFFFSLLLSAPTFVYGIIVLDGANSFSTYTGKPKNTPVLFPDVSEGTTTLLHVASEGQIDYTTFDTTAKRSNITDSNGMVIQAEGFYAATKGKAPGAISSFRRGYKVSQFLGGTLFYQIKVKTPGTYTFALDASSLHVTKNKHYVQLFAISERGERTDADARWENHYSTGDWNKMVMGYGGPVENEPYSVKMELNRSHITLAITWGFINDIGGIQVDALRVIDFSDGLIGSIKEHQIEQQKLKEIQQHLWSQNRPSSLLQKNEYNEEIKNTDEPNVWLKNTILGLPLIFLIVFSLLIKNKKQ